MGSKACKTPLKFLTVNSVYSIWNDIFLFFLETVIFTTLFQRLPTFWNSTLKMTALIQRCLTLFILTLKYTALIRRRSTLTITNVEIHNVVSTLIWCCPTRDVVSTKRQRWNNVEMFAGKFSRSLVHNKKFGLIWQVVFKLRYLFCEGR